MQGQSIARTAGDQAEGGGGSDERLGHFVHRAVSADGDHAGAATGHRRSRQRGRVPRRLGGNEFGVELVGRDESRNRRHQFGIAPVFPRMRVEDEARFHASGAAGSEDGVEAAADFAPISASTQSTMTRAASGRARAARAVRQSCQTAP